MADPRQDIIEQYRALVAARQSLQNQKDVALGFGAADVATFGAATPVRTMSKGVGAAADVKRAAIPVKMAKLSDEAAQIAARKEPAGIAEARRRVEQGVPPASAADPTGALSQRILEEPGARFSMAGPQREGVPTWSPRGVPRTLDETRSMVEGSVRNYESVKRKSDFFDDAAKEYKRVITEDIGLPADDVAAYIEKNGMQPKLLKHDTGKKWINKQVDEGNLSSVDEFDSIFYNEQGGIDIRTLQANAQQEIQGAVQRLEADKEILGDFLLSSSPANVRMRGELADIAMAEHLGLGPAQMSSVDKAFQAKMAQIQASGRPITEETLEGIVAEAARRKMEHIRYSDFSNMTNAEMSQRLHDLEIKIIPHTTHPKQKALQEEVAQEFRAFLDGTTLENTKATYRASSGEMGKAAFPFQTGELALPEELQMDAFYDLVTGNALKKGRSLLQAREEAEAATRAAAGKVFGYDAAAEVAKREQAGREAMEGVLKKKRQLMAQAIQHPTKKRTAVEDARLSEEWAAQVRAGKAGLFPSSAQGVQDISQLSTEKKVPPPGTLEGAAEYAKMQAKVRAGFVPVAAPYFDWRKADRELSNVERQIEDLRKNASPEDRAWLEDWIMSEGSPPPERELKRTEWGEPTEE